MFERHIRFSTHIPSLTGRQMRAHLISTHISSLTGRCGYGWTFVFYPHFVPTTGLRLCAMITFSTNMPSLYGTTKGDASDFYPHFVPMGLRLCGMITFSTNMPSLTGRGGYGLTFVFYPHFVPTGLRLCGMITFSTNMPSLTRRGGYGWTFVFYRHFVPIRDEGIPLGI